MAFAGAILRANLEGQHAGISHTSFGIFEPLICDVFSAFTSGKGHHLVPKPDHQVLNMEQLLSEYLPIVIFLGLSAVIALALLVVPFVIAPSIPDPEKLSAYECGFDAFDDSRMRFDVKFYLVAILFIIFDLEVAFLFPWAISLGDVGLFGFWSMMVFLGILTIGFIYEWKKGALEWD